MAFQRRHGSGAEVICGDIAHLRMVAHEQGLPARREGEAAVRALSKGGRAPLRPGCRVVDFRPAIPPEGRHEPAVRREDDLNDRGRSRDRESLEAPLGFEEA